MSSNPPTYSGEDGNPSEDSFQTTAASPNAWVQQNITPVSNADIQHEGNTNDASPAPSPSLEGSRRPSSPTDSREVVAPLDCAPDGSNEDLHGVFEGPSSLAGYASNNVRRLAEAQQQPGPPTLSAVTNTSTPRSGSSRAVSPAGWLKKECEQLRKKQQDFQINIKDPSRTPVRADFPSSLSVKIVNPVKPVQNCIILMHNLANNEASLKSLAQTLQSKQPEAAFILLRGLQPIEQGNSGYHWADANGTLDEGFIRTSRVVLEDIIQDVLMAKCSFHPRDIMVLGHGQGGMAALAATASWECVEFGGVVSLGGPMPGYVQLPSNVKAKTPALIFGSARGDITPAALLQIQENFSFTDHHAPPSGQDIVPSSEEEIAPLLDFFAHRLGREEWRRQAVISFGKNLHRPQNLI